MDKHAQDIMRRMLAAIDNEIEQRKNSGNDEYWSDLQDLSDDAHARLKHAESASASTDEEDRAMAAMIEEADSEQSEKPRRFTAQVWRRELLDCSEHVIVIARSEREALEKIRDGDIEDATNWEVADTTTTDLYAIEELEVRP